MSLDFQKIDKEAELERLKAQRSANYKQGRAKQLEQTKEIREENRKLKLQQEEQERFELVKKREQEAIAKITLTMQEEYNIEQAKKYSIKHYTKILPLPGTLAYFTRDIIGGNQAVINLLRGYLQNTTTTSNTNKLIKGLVFIWEQADNFSQQRVDIFDHICNKIKLKTKVLWGAIQQELFEHNTIETKYIISKNTPNLAKDVLEFARDKKEFSDRELATKITGLITDKPSIVIDQSVNNNNLNVTSNFRDLLDKTDNVIDIEEDEDINTDFEESVEVDQQLLGN